MLDKQIQEKAEKLYPEEISTRQLSLVYHINDVALFKQSSFIKGAQWAFKQSEQRCPSEWVDVNERLPENLVEVNVHLKSGYVTSLNYGESSGFFNAMSNTPVSKNNPVTHWMPLPSPPKSLFPKVGENA